MNQSILNPLELEINKFKGYDKNIFEEKGDKLITTVYFKYIAANYAKELFKNKIIELDKENIYTKVNEVEDVDLKLFQITKLQYEESNAKNIALANAEKDQWKHEHLHYYRIQPSLPTSTIYKHLFVLPDNLSLDDAVQGYKLCNEILKSIDNSELDKYCIETKLMLNYEYRDEYRKAMDEIDDKYGILTDSKIKEKLPKVKVNKVRISMNRQKCSDINPLLDFTKCILCNVKSM